MTTFVGSQQTFNRAIVSLLELEYDAIEAYLKAVDMLEKVEYKEKLRSFTNDHYRHIRQLSMLLTLHRIDFSPGPDLKQWLTKSKVLLANLIGDHSILAAIASNEADTNAAYDHVLTRDDVWEDAYDLLNAAREDERRHKKWLETQLM